MSATSKLRGHLIEQRDDEWFYVDTGEPTAATYRDRACGYCGQPDTDEGHDACLGTLPGLMNACCGHGSDREAYVQMLDGTLISGADAKVVIEILKKYSWPDEPSSSTMFRSARHAKSVVETWPEWKRKYRIGKVPGEWD